MAVIAAPRPAARTITPYNGLILLAILTNAVVAGELLRSSPSWRSMSNTTLTATSVNLGIATLSRQQYVVRAMFGLATRAPRHWPLRVRVALANVYHYGGVHVGCAVSATLWFLAFAVLAAPSQPHVMAVVLAIAADLLVMVVFASAFVRERHHNAFEMTHRLGGWLALVLFAVLAVLQTVASGDSVLNSANVWVLAVVAVSIAIPWLQVRKVPVTMKPRPATSPDSESVPSSHAAVARFDDGVRPSAGSWTRLARHPFGEWHSFANIPEPGTDGYRIVISRAGDWTGKFVDDAPAAVWVRGAPTPGVAAVARLFTRVVWVATGSGIAPCLPHLFSGETPARLVWITRNPERTYGRELVDEIRAAQPDALIWDTDANGKPDLVELAHAAYVACGAEAIICISNKSTTIRTVAALRARAVPAYGPIWDS